MQKAAPFIIEIITLVRPIFEPEVWVSDNDWTLEHHV